MTGNPLKPPGGFDSVQTTITACIANGNSRLELYRVLVLLLALLPAMPAAADTFMGIRAGAISVDVASRKNPRNLAAYLGFQLDTQLADISLAGEVSRTVSKGGASGGDLEFEYEALYLRARTTSSLFVSMRGGFVRDKVISGDNSGRDDGFLLGGGIGVVSGKMRILVEYTSIAGDADFLSLGLEF